MSESGLASVSLREKHASDISGAKTFVTEGVSRQVAADYLDTRSGRLYLHALVRADPDAPISRLYRRAIDQLTSGSELPRMEMIDEPLVKIVPRGESV